MPASASPRFGRASSAPTPTSEVPPGGVTHRARSQLRSAAARLESLSPLAVLGRGYAVAWDAAKTRIIRDPATLTPGDTIRVTVERGEIGCEVKSTS